VKLSPLPAALPDRVLLDVMFSYLDDGVLAMCGEERCERQMKVA
jgi:hypothetical protein